MGEAARVPVLMYHQVGLAGDAVQARYAVAPAVFAAHMQALAAAGYHAVTIDALVDWLEGGAPLAEGAFLLSFDDGFRGVRDHALPVLEALAWPFTVFLVSERIGGEDDWTRSRHSPLLNGEEIRDMQGRGCSFHSHTCTHASLPSLDDAELARQLHGSREALATLLGCEVRYLAYPYGHVDQRVEDATRAAGYRAAFATQAGFNRPDVNRFRVRRLDVYGSDSPPHLLRKMRLGSNDGSLAGQITYYVTRAVARLVARPAARLSRRK